MNLKDKIIEANKKAVGSRIKEIRKINKLTQSAFSEKIYMSQDSVSLWERGKSFPTYLTTIMICDTFEISEDWIIYGEGEMKSYKKNIIRERNQMELRILKKLEVLNDISPNYIACIEKIVDVFIEQQ